MDSTLTSTAEPMMSEPKSRGVVVEGSSTSSSSTVAAQQQPQPQPQPQPPSRYGSQKTRDWNTFQHYLKSHKPPLTLARCSGAHVIEFLKYLDQFGKTEVHISGCPSFGHPNPPSPCSCPLNQAWGSLDALIGRLRAAYEENGGKPDSNPFAARPVRIYLRGVRQGQTKARGIPYEKKKRNHQNTYLSSTTTTSSSDHVTVAHHQLVVHDTAGSGGANSDSSSSHYVATIVVSTTTVTTVDIDPTPTTTTTTTVA